MKPRREKRCRPKSCLSRILFVLFNLPSVSWKTLFQNRDWSICSFFYFLALQAAYLAWGRCYILLLNTKLFYAAFDVVGQIDVACLLCGWFCWISEDKVYFQPLATPFPAVLKASTGEHKVSCFTHSLHRPPFPPQLSHTHLSVVQFWNPQCCQSLLDKHTFADVKQTGRNRLLVSKIGHLMFCSVCNSLPHLIMVEF